MIYSCGRLQSDTNLEAVFFFLRNNHVVFSIIQHWLSSLLYSGLSQTFKNSVCTCCFSDRQRHYIFLTCMGSPNPYFLICHGALGEEVVVLCRIVSIYWLDYLDGPQIWLTRSFIQEHFTLAVLILCRCWGLCSLGELCPACRRSTTSDPGLFF